MITITTSGNLDIDRIEKLQKDLKAVNNAIDVEDDNGYYIYIERMEIWNKLKLLVTCRDCKHITASKNSKGRFYCPKMRVNFDNSEVCMWGRFELKRMPTTFQLF